MISRVASGKVPAQGQTPDQRGNTVAEDQYAKQDPQDQFRSPDRQDSDRISHPGTTGEMDVEPDHGEESYRGTGRLAGKRAIITGGDSGSAGRSPSRSPGRALTFSSPTCRRRRTTPGRPRS